MERTFIFRHKITGESHVVKGPDKDFAEAWFENQTRYPSDVKVISDEIRGNWILISNTGTLTNKKQ